MLKTIALATLLALAGTAAGAAETKLSPYAGQETRQIKSLSAKDVDDLRNGRGWGLAKAAELNGVPGPTHLLDLAEEIGLDAAQVAKLRTIKQAMTAQAKPLGEKLVALETELDRQFASGEITDRSLRELLAQIAETRRELRYTHLATHFKTPPLLTAQQTAAYNSLRGYAPAVPYQAPAKSPNGESPHNMKGGAHGGH
jgi:Spy/CpxP family protein refolding chaperone